MSKALYTIMRLQYRFHSVTMTINCDRLMTREIAFRSASERRNAKPKTKLKNNRKRNIGEGFPKRTGVRGQYF